MRVLSVTTLFPNNREPRHGIFVYNRLRHLVADFPDIEVKVIAPVPWFPFAVEKGPLAQYAKYVGVANRESFGEIEVLHPRYLVIPKIGMYLTPFFLFLACWRAARELRRQGYQFEVIDAHYFYPDGVAAAMLSRLINVPFSITARGSDVHQIADYPLAARMIGWAARRAGAVITVCQALMAPLKRLANIEEREYVLRNGVDLDFFTFASKEERIHQREQWKVMADQKLVISVGRLIELKGHHLIIEALRSLPDCHLIVAGDGPEERGLKRLAAESGVCKRVTFAGSLPQEDLRGLYQAADVLVLASSREGWANVLLESMACGTPVVATNLWGTPEVVASQEAGVLVERTSEAIADGITRLFSATIDRQKTRAYAEKFDWYSTSKGQYDIFTELLTRRDCKEQQDSHS